MPGQQQQGAGSEVLHLGHEPRCRQQFYTATSSALIPLGWVMILEGADCCPMVTPGFSGGQLDLWPF